MVSWALLPFFNLTGMEFNANSIVTSIVLILLGIAHPLVIFKPQWNKAILLIEGLVFAAAGLIFLEPLDNLFLLITGSFLIIISLLAYIKKLPRNLLRFFYKTPK